jgi:hypothetical protein
MPLTISTVEWSMDHAVFRVFKVILVILLVVA